MGNLRVPKTHYFKYGLVQFYAKKNEIHFKVYLWLESGSKRILIRDSKFTIPLEQIIAEIPKQSFSSVGVNQ